MPPLQPNDEEKQEELPGDEGSTPFSMPDDVPSSPADNQKMETNVDSDEAYQKGPALAAGLDDPQAGSYTDDEGNDNDSDNEGFDSDGTDAVEEDKDI